MCCAEKVVHYRPVSWELGGSQVDELHPIDPGLFGFCHGRTLSPCLGDVLQEFWNVASWCGPAVSWWKRLRTTWRPFPAVAGRRLAARPGRRSWGCVGGHLSQGNGTSSGLISRVKQHSSLYHRPRQHARQLVWCAGHPLHSYPPPSPPHTLHHIPVDPDRGPPGIEERRDDARGSVPAGYSGKSGR
jgi:hypothetical protein